MISTTTPPAASAELVNIARRLARTAANMPDALAVVAAQPRGWWGPSQRKYHSVTFAELDRDSAVLASGLRRHGIQPGMRIVLMVRPSVDFISLTFGLFRTGAVTVLIDPGMGRENLLQCLTDVEPDGFVATPLAQAVRVACRRRFPKARHNVTVGARWFWGGPTINQLRSDTGSVLPPVNTRGHDPAAIIFTTGSTGPPKGVLYSHGNFDAQVDQIRNRYHIEPGGVDLAGFPLFGLFNCAMGTTTVIPDMDASRPASVDPANIVEAIHDWTVTQAFASPAVWGVVGRHCQQFQERLPTLQRVLCAGAPVPPRVLESMRQVISPAGEIFTPYGATEALPVASISAAEVLTDTVTKSRQGAGTCVGQRFDNIEWRVIAVSDDPLHSIDDATELPCGEIGELIVRGPQVTQEYVTRTAANSRAKIRDGDGLWHRMGDLGYFDEANRFWFCGRKNHRVETRDGTMYSVCCEAIFNNHDAIFRSALVGIGLAGQQTPVMICEPCRPIDETHTATLRAELAELATANKLTEAIRPEHILLHESLPVDIRHNAKIFREELAVWAEKKLAIM